MGNELFGIDIAGIVAKEIGPGLLDAVLTKKTSGTRTSGNLTGGTNPVTTAHTAKGIKQPLTSLRPDSIVENAVAAVLLIGDTISPVAVPAEQDLISIEGTSYTIVKIERDPAAATYTCQVKS